MLIINGHTGFRSDVSAFFVGKDSFLRTAQPLARIRSSLTFPPRRGRAGFVNTAGRVFEHLIATEQPFPKARFHEEMHLSEKTALIVEGGGLRGAFAVGVLRVLLREFGSEYFDAILAASSGVFAATYFAANQGEEMEHTWRDRVWGTLLVNHWNWFTTKPVLGLDYLVDLFKGPVRLDTEAVMRARSSIEYVLTDYLSGRAAYFDAKRPDIFDLMRASSALPRVYPLPVMIDGHPFYDGGQSDPIPLARAISQGATRVVVVRTRPKDYVKKPRSRRIARLLLPEVPLARAEWSELHERYNATLELIANPPQGVKVLTIAPRDLRVGRLTQSRVQIIAAIEHGKEIAQAELSERAHFFELR
jgi:predicted patatin/cPLA2 family phospholipase